MPQCIESNLLIPRDMSQFVTFDMLISHDVI